MVKEHLIKQIKLKNKGFFIIMIIFSKLKEGLEISKVAKEVIGERKRFYKKKYISAKPIPLPRPSIKKHVPTYME